MTTPQRYFCSICEEPGDICSCYQEIDWNSVSQSETILTNSPTPVCGICLKSTIECYCDKTPIGFGQHIMNPYSDKGDTCIQCGILAPSNQVCGWGEGLDDHTRMVHTTPSPVETNRKSRGGVRGKKVRRKLDFQSVIKDFKMKQQGVLSESRGDLEVYGLRSLYQITILAGQTSEVSTMTRIVRGDYDRCGHLYISRSPPDYWLNHYTRPGLTVKEGTVSPEYAGLLNISLYNHNTGDMTILPGTLIACLSYSDYTY